MCCYRFALLIIAATLHSVSMNPVLTTEDQASDGGCHVQNRLVEYNLNGYVSMINIPECVVNTAYVIRSTITSDPADVARFIETNRRCCCEVARFTRRQIRIGHILHKYNEIESCSCGACASPPPVAD